MHITFSVTGYCDSTVYHHNLKKSNNNNSGDELVVSDIEVVEEDGWEWVGPAAGGAYG